MNIRNRKASRVFNQVLKLTLGNFLVCRLNVKGLAGDLPRLTPPYIVLANHVGFWDPFILSIFIRDPIHFVASDEYFRKPVLKFLLSLVGAIPKSKFISDSETVKGILHIFKRKGVIGIFPEGRRTWDGCTTPLLFPTTKLIKKLGIPVVTAKFQGGYLANPRWSRNCRRGEVTVRYNIALTSEQIKKAGPEEIHSVITGYLAHNEYEYQEKAMIPFKGKRLAERLELFLFTCPRCKSLDTMKSSGSSISCSCGFSAGLNEYGFFEQDSSRLPFRNPMEWNNWQQENLGMLLRSNNDGSPLMTNDNAVCKSGNRLTPFRNIKSGSLSLFSDKIVFTSSCGESNEFNLKDIAGLNIQYNDLFEFYYFRKLYRFSFEGQGISAFKWTCAIDKCKELSYSKRNPEREDSNYGF
jgi:1-acyl-sn-glycerol-3-phosphate acyltransferase